jgi:F-type H+-transporting ATPase subunit epsilon
MKVSVVTPRGELYSEEVDYVVVTSKMNGEFAIMKNHIPIISTIDTGYVKMVRDEKELYTVVINGVVEFQSNVCNVIAQEAHVGMNKVSAMDHLNTVREERIRENKRRNVDFLRAEQDLKKGVKESKAGNL